MLSDYDDLFIEVCADLDLPWLKVLAFAKTLTGLTPEFRDRDLHGPRVGLMAFPEREAVHYGTLPGDLVIPRRCIRAGCEALREYYEEFWELGQDVERLHAAFNYYLRDWPAILTIWKNRYTNTLVSYREKIKQSAAGEI